MPRPSNRRTAAPGRGNNPKLAVATPAARQAVVYARVSSREQEREGFSIPAQQALLKKYAADNGFAIVEEFIDVETAKKSGRSSFTKMLAMLKKKGDKAPVVLVEKTDRLYRNLKDWVALDEMKVDVHFVKEGIVVSEESRSSEKFIHGIKVQWAGRRSRLEDQPSAGRTWKSPKLTYAVLQIDQHEARSERSGQRSAHVVPQSPGPRGGSEERAGS
jgi:hypothetical protein